MTLRDACLGHPEVSFPEGSVLIAQGSQSGHLFVLLEGDVAVLRDGIEVTVIGEPLTIFGEMSVLLDRNHTASVIARTPVRAYVIDDGPAFMKDSPVVLLHISRMLARRLYAMTGYLADLKQQYGDRADHFAMVDEILGCLSHYHEPDFKLGSDREPSP